MQDVKNVAFVFELPVFIPVVALSVKKIEHDIIDKPVKLERFHRKLMRFLRILFMRSRQKVMTSLALMYSSAL